MWIFIEERFRGHDHAVHAVTALRGLLFDEGRLQRVRMLERAQAFERGDAAVLRAADGNAAGAHSVSVHDDGARAALAESAPESGAVQFEVIAQDIEERGGGIGVHNPSLVIHSKRDSRHATLLSSSELGEI